MKNKKLLLPLVLQPLLIVTLLSSCADNKLSTDAASLVSSGLQNGQSNDQPIGAPAIDQVDMKSYVDDSSNKLGGLNGALGFDLDKVRGEFIIMVPMPSGLVFTPSGSFSKYPDITFSPVFDATGKVKVAVRVPVKYVLKGTTFIEPSRLPNGDPLPAMPAGQGELPSLALSFPQNNNTQINLYIGINALGLLVSLPNSAALPLPINITVPLKNRDKTKTFGYLTYVNSKNGFPPGLFISTGVPNSFARILEDYFGLN